MARYIELDAVGAEIERQISAIDNCPKLTGTQIAVLEGNKVVLTKLLSFINTLEVKEIELDALGVLAEHLIACEAHAVTPKYTDKELDLLEEWAKNNKPQKGE